MGSKQSKLWKKIDHYPSDMLYGAKIAKINQFEYIIAPRTIPLSNEFGLYLWNIQSGDTTLIAKYPSSWAAPHFDFNTKPRTRYNKLPHTLKLVSNKQVHIISKAP